MNVYFYVRQRFPLSFSEMPFRLKFQKYSPTFNKVKEVQQERWSYKKKAGIRFFEHLFESRF